MGLRFLRNRRFPPSTKEPFASSSKRERASVDQQWSEGRAFFGWSWRTYDITDDRFAHWLRVFPIEVYW